MEASALKAVFAAAAFKDARHARFAERLVVEEMDGGCVSPLMMQQAISHHLASHLLQQGWSYINRCFIKSGLDGTQAQPALRVTAQVLASFDVSVDVEPGMVKVLGMLDDDFSGQLREPVPTLSLPKYPINYAYHDHNKSNCCAACLLP